MGRAFPEQRIEPMPPFEANANLDEFGMKTTSVRFGNQRRVVGRSNEPEQAEETAVRIMKGKEFHLSRKPFALRVDHQNGTAGRSSREGFGRGIKRACEVGEVSRSHWSDGLTEQADDLIGRVAGQVFESSIHADESSVGSKDERRFASLREQRIQPKTRCARSRH